MNYVKIRDLSKPQKGFYGLGASATGYSDDLPQYLRITDIDDFGNAPAVLPTCIDINIYTDWKHYLLRKNDIVFARTGNSTGRNYFCKNISRNIVFAGFLIKFTIDSELVIPQYVGYYCQSQTYWNSVKSLFTGSTRANINAKQYGDLLIPIINKDIQQHIVNTIGSVDDLIEKELQIKNKLMELARLKFDTILSKSSKICVMLKDIVSQISTGLNPRKNFKLGEGDNYYVTIKNFENGVLSLDDKCDKVNDEAIQKINKRSKLEKGDILFSSIGRIGSTYLIERTPKNWNISESVFSIRASQKITSEILYIILSSKQVYEYVNSNASGSAQQGIRISSLLECPIVMPDGKELDLLKIYFKNIFDNISNINRKLSLLKSQKNLLLNKYF